MNIRFRLERKTVANPLGYIEYSYFYRIMQRLPICQMLENFSSDQQ